MNDVITVEDILFYNKRETYFINFVNVRKTGKF